MAERVGFEFTRKRSFNNIERTAGNVKRWKTVVGSANGSQTDHCHSDYLKSANEGDRTLMFYRVVPSKPAIADSFFGGSADLRRFR
jgi:hypothetical protein